MTVFSLANVAGPPRLGSRPVSSLVSDLASIAATLAAFASSLDFSISDGTIGF